MLSVWQFGDFSAVLAGRYELLWLTGGLCVLAYIIADKLTIVGLGDNIALNLGISKRQVTWLGVGMVAMMSAVVVVTVASSRTTRCFSSTALRYHRSLYSLSI